ncbi:MAG: hypothetical protein IJS53_00695 [Clostridia bacterium]|nr:hypothetical protein [Clostridia bacterium]
MDSDSEKTRRARGIALLALLSALAVSAILLLGSPTRAVSRSRETVEEGCVLIQTLRYARCGHEAVRRVQADQEYTGCTLRQMQEAWAEWTITSFSPGEIEMTRTLPLYCPDHLVVMPDGTGILGIYENTYGEGYSLRTQLDIPVSALPESLRASIHLGVAFKSAEEIESWLETLES